VDRQPLCAAKLRALVGARWGPGEGDDGIFPGGATLRRGVTGWVLAEERPERALGGALAWALRRGVTELHLVVSTAAGHLARRAEAFSLRPHVWRVEGTELHAAEPEPIQPPAGLRPEAEPFVDLIRAAGAEPVVEHGMLLGEVLGLEVVRVVVDDMGADLQVGVGKHDREAQRLVHGDRPPLDALTAAVTAVRERRRADAAVHQVNQLAGEGWLRAVVTSHPDLVGARRLEPVAPPVPRGDLRLPRPAPAAGEDVDGNPLVVVCSTGVDVDLVPAAADARLLDGRDPRLVLVLPEGDDHPMTRTLAAALDDPAEVVTVEREWRNLSVA
jgi:hypothetical protein